MKFRFLVASVVLILAGMVSADEPNVRVIHLEELKSILEPKSDTTYFVNFWATWCAPCVKELPYIQELHEEYSDKPVKFLLISLDFPELLNERLIPFVSSRNIQIETVLLDAPNDNIWIPLVDSSWTGAIPATLIYNQNDRVFFEGKVSKARLNKSILQMLHE